MVTPKHKRPTFEQRVRAEKRARAVQNPDSYLDQHPTWRVHQLQLCAPYGWHALTLDEATAIQHRLGALETMTWNEILFADGGRQNHIIGVEKLCAEVQERLRDIAPDIDQLMSLRVSKRERVFGIMDREVCHVIFWDPCHDIYDMNIADN